MAAAMGMLSLPVVCDVEVNGIVPERILVIESVEADEVGVRLNYHVEPPFPVHPLGVHFDGHVLGALQDWGFEVTDDCGTEYTSGGGAHGRTSGVRTVTPRPPTGARRLLVTLHPYMRDSPRYGIRIDVPSRHAWLVPATDLKLVALG